MFNVATELPDELNTLIDRPRPHSGSAVNFDGEPRQRCRSDHEAGRCSACTKINRTTTWKAAIAPVEPKNLALRTDDSTQCFDGGEKPIGIFSAERMPQHAFSTT